MIGGQRPPDLKQLFHLVEIPLERYGLQDSPKNVVTVSVYAFEFFGGNKPLVGPGIR